MTAPEIIERIKRGESVVIPAKYGWKFMRECERHQVGFPVYMEFDGDKCTLSPPERGGAR